MKMLNNIKSFFKKLNPFSKPVLPSSSVKMEDGTEAAPRMRTGNSNGLLSVQERQHANRALKQAKKKKKNNKQQRISRNINHKIH